MCALQCRNQEGMGGEACYREKKWTGYAGCGCEKSTAPFTSQYHGESYYFCAKECKEQFDQNPEFYMKGFEGRKP